MKRSIFVINLLVFLVLSAAAQNIPAALAGSQNQKETKLITKAVYSPDLTKKVDISLQGISLQELNDYLFYEQRGPAIDDSTDISAKDAKRVKTNAAKVIMALGKKFDDIIEADKDKWKKTQPDTVKLISNSKKSKS